MIHRKIAEESDKTIKAREKLKRQFEEIENQITPEALRKKTEEINLWISRHANNRITLKNKNISLFDENQNVAKISKTVERILNRIRKNTLSSREGNQEPLL